MFKVIFKITILTIFFSFLIFYTKNYFFGGLSDYENQMIEDNYIEPGIDKEIINEKVLEKLQSAEKVGYDFIPNTFLENENVLSYKDLLNTFFYSNYLDRKYDFVNIELNEEKFDVRGRMEDKIVKLFGVLNIEKKEFLSLAIHEFSHYFDLYILKKSVTKDLSDYFYEISWEKTKVLKAGMKQEDFVSGYAMTNKYEDFAESFTYYVVHNSDFLEKSNNSEILMQKYNFFKNYVFKNEEFNFNYKNKEELKEYYRDTTKIDYDLNQFEEYLRKE